MLILGDQGKLMKAFEGTGVPEVIQIVLEETVRAGVVLPEGVRPALLGRSAATTAIAAILIALTRWPALVRYRDDGALEIDNNTAERALDALQRLLPPTVKVRRDGGTRQVSAADLVLSRAGAGTLAELVRCETPAILIPYPTAADNHQYVNALEFAQTGAHALRIRWQIERAERANLAVTDEAGIRFNRNDRAVKNGD